MRLVKWEDLPANMQNASVRPYYEILNKRKGSLFIKRVFDIIASLILIVILSPVMLVLIIWIKADSDGPALFKQTRATQYGREFKVWKFRTMVVNAESMGHQVTSDNDPRITNVGSKLRNHRLDELPQLFNVLGGSMSFVGTRPEVTKFVECYNNEMRATLLLPAGITSKASVWFRNEDEMLFNADDLGKVYIEKVLPKKMALNLEALKRFSCWDDFKTMLLTVKVVFGK